MRMKTLTLLIFSGCWDTALYLKEREPVSTGGLLSIKTLTMFTILADVPDYLLEYLLDQFLDTKDYTRWLLTCHSFYKPLNRHLKVLVLSRSFNKTSDHLPSSLTSLVFEERFNRPVDHLPCSLTRLSFGREFDQPVDPDIFSYSSVFS